MMYKESRDCKPPPDNAVLWRYMDFTKFVSLLDKQALFFARADKLVLCHINHACVLG